MTIKSISGWALDRACEIDFASAGFLGSLFRSSHERRHVIFTYLSAADPARRFGDDAALGVFLTNAGHDEILTAAVGVVPPGLRSCLSKSGDRPHPRRHYRYLPALLANARRSDMCEIIRKLALVTPERIQIIRALPKPMREVRLVTALRNVDDARDLARLYNLLIRAGVAEAALTQATSTITTMADIRRLASRWSQRISFPPHPVPATHGYVPIETGAALKDAAIRLRNCARNYIPRIMEERSAFALVAVGNSEAMVHLTRNGQSWELDALYGSGNCIPDKALEELATEHLTRNGLTRRVIRRVEREWACLRRLSGYHDYETD